MAYRSDLYKTAKFNFPGVTFAALLLQGRTGRPSTPRITYFTIVLGPSIDASAGMPNKFYIGRVNKGRE